MNRQKMILSVLIAVFLGAVVYSYLRMPRQKSVADLKYKPGTVLNTGRSAAKTTEAKTDDKKLHLALLNRQVSDFQGFHRNIFKPIFHEETKSLPLPLPSPHVRTALPVPPPPAAPPPKVAEPTPVQQEMAKFTFLGFLKKDNKKTIFLSSNNEIFLVKKGDKISGKYEVANITDEALSINVLPDGGEIIIPLIENKPLNAPRK